MIIVTGASGYIGGVISLKLKDAGYNIIGLDRRPCPDHLKLCFDQFVKSDFVDPSALQFIADAKANITPPTFICPEFVSPKAVFVK